MSRRKLPHTEAFGPFLRTMRESVNLSQEHCAELAGITKGTLSRVERGEREPSIELIARLARIIADALAAERGAA